MGRSVFVRRTATSPVSHRRCRGRCAPTPLRARRRPKATGVSISSLKPHHAQRLASRGAAAMDEVFSHNRQSPFFGNHSRGLHSLVALSTRLDSTPLLAPSEPSRPQSASASHSGSVHGALPGAPQARGLQGGGGQTACTFFPVTEHSAEHLEALRPSPGFIHSVR